MQKVRSFVFFILPGVLMLQILLGSVAWMVVREAHRHKVKWEILRSLEEHELTQIAMWPGEFKNARLKDKGKEIEHEGKMYDIVRISISGGKVVLHCFDDKKETNLLTLARNAAKEERNSQSTHHEGFYFFCETDEFPSLLMPDLSPISRVIIFANPDAAFTEYWANVPTPPPDFTS
jgi:hypothetical protein